MSDKTRNLIYGGGVLVFIILAGIAVAFGVISDTNADTIVATVVAIVGSIGGASVSGLAKKNIRPTVTETVVNLQDLVNAIQGNDTDGYVGKRRAEPETTPTVLDRIGDTVTTIRTRADQVRARYGQM